MLPICVDNAASRLANASRSAWLTGGGAGVLSSPPPPPPTVSVRPLSSTVDPPPGVYTPSSLIVFIGLSGPATVTPFPFVYVTVPPGPFGASIRIRPPSSPVLIRLSTPRVFALLTSLSVG